MEELSISIIVPVYNAESYLERCVESVIAQTWKSWELILIDDGSIDSSGEICDEFSKKDKRIKVLHQKNAGVSAARNQGIRTARGKYIGFVDSDDWIEPNMFEQMLQKAMNTGSDVVMCDAITVFGGGNTQLDTITQLSGNCILKKSDFTPSLLLEMAGSACRCIYRNDRDSDKPRKYQLIFPLGIKFSEDRIFNLYAFGQANQIAYVKIPFYNRYMNERSTVHRFHEDYFEAYKKADKGIEQAIKCVWDDNSALRNAYFGQLIGGALGAICNYYYKSSTLSVKERRMKIKKLCDDQQLRTAIKTHGADRKSQWILNKRYSMLIIYARLANWKHGR